MPEGHSVHRIALQFARNFVGREIAVSSPQGRFAQDAELIDGRTMTSARAVGKQLFLGFGEDLFLRVHLGLYGAWDFQGEISTVTVVRRRRGSRGRGAPDAGGDAARVRGVDELVDPAGEDSETSMGAPRRARWRMAERESPLAGEAESREEPFPPDPFGQVRARLLTDTAVADLRGPTACLVQRPDEVQAVLDRLGPDPLVDTGDDAAERFVDTITGKRTPIGLLLMDQSVVSGIGNIFRAELLFRARIDPHTPGRDVPRDDAERLWEDWGTLLERAVATGMILTRDGLSGSERRRAERERSERFWVYKREGLPCRVCGTNVLLEEMGSRKLYWCPEDQVRPA